MGAQSEYVHVAHTFLAHLAPLLYAQSVLRNKISASELRRKFMKSALLVGTTHSICGPLNLRRDYYFSLPSPFLPASPSLAKSPPSPLLLLHPQACGGGEGGGGERIQLSILPEERERERENLSNIFRSGGRRISRGCDRGWRGEGQITECVRAQTAFFCVCDGQSPPDRTF